MTIGFGAGGGVDLYGRTLGRHLVRYLPGQPALVVLNQLGAGGVVALNDWGNKAAPNGLFVTIGAQSQTDPDALIRTHAKYDTTTFNYVGGLAAYSQGLFVNKDAVERLYNTSAKPVVMGLVRLHPAQRQLPGALGCGLPGLEREMDTRLYQHR